ncbi:hypothetical protein P5G65_04860 [Paenibacillus chondroitinus]|uniref:Uncharacterized protein n=1 Tax=Paenibacillus chondroitinus TaxID=59842 RepID=A0ABU6D701_9BACL|nr:MULTISPECIES: hypothetical protein [Paenibacillus]MCY9658122.1 hypothetical protein [Paenibacillus anseongense]MEB4793216.1 hypothetical protein [Paenibacillus chondroitinus]
MAFGNVAAERVAIESTYEGSCTVTAFQTVKHPITHVTGQQRINLFENEPCGLSQTTLASSIKTETDNTIAFDAKLFISPDVTITAGCEIRVLQNGMDQKFEQVGEPFRYATHQEILLKQVGRA